MIIYPPCTTNPLRWSWWWLWLWWWWDL